MTSFQIDPSFTGYGKTGVRLLKIRRSGKYHGIKQIEVSTELKLNNYDDYFRGDNASIVPTDTQKNTVYALAKQHQASKFIHLTVQPFYVFRALSVTRTNLLDYKQLLDEVFVIFGIIKVEVTVITLTETLIIPDITKTESNNCFIIHCFEENNDKRIIIAITVYFQTLKNVQLRDKQIFTVFIKQSSALGNHALRAQPTDYSLICRYRLVNNL